MRSLILRNAFFTNIFITIRHWFSSFRAIYRKPSCKISEHTLAANRRTSNIPSFVLQAIVHPFHTVRQSLSAKQTIVSPELRSEGHRACTYDIGRQEIMTENPLEPKPIEITPSRPPEAYVHNSRIIVGAAIRARKSDEGRSQNTTIHVPERMKNQVFLCSKCRKLFNTRLELSGHQDHCNKAENVAGSPATLDQNTMNPPQHRSMVSENSDESLQCKETPKSVYIFHL